MIRPRTAGLALALALVLPLAASCSDGDDDGAAPASSSATTTSSTEGGGGASTTEEATSTLPDETTTTAAPPVAGSVELQTLLIDPARFGDGFGLDPTLGNGTFSGELCEEVTLEQTWVDQASQALSAGQGDERRLVTQAVLELPDEGAAEAFVQAVVTGNETCLPDAGEVTDVVVGDGGVVIDIPSGDTSTSVAVIRSGTRVVVFDALYPTAAGSPLTSELLDAAGTALAG